MTVRELIKALEEHEPDALVVLDHPTDWPTRGVFGVRSGIVFKGDRGRMELLGEDDLINPIFDRDYLRVVALEREV